MPRTRPPAWWAAACATATGLALAFAVPAITEVIGRTSDYPMQPNRAETLHQTLHALSAGYPPLTALGPSGALDASGACDDQGLYLFAPLLTRAFGGHDPVSTWKYVAIGGWVLSVLVAPFVFSRVWNRAAGLLAPVVVGLLAIGFQAVGDLYWVAPWAMLTLLPVLMMIASRPRLGWAGGLVVAGVMVVASAVAAVRGGVTLGLLVSAVAIVVWRRRSWPQAMVLVVVVSAAYLSVNVGVMDVVRQHRTAALGRDLSAESASSHVLWHSVYIGLGYLPNRYQIHYRDQYGVAAARQTRPGVVFCSREYERILRSRTLRIARDDPAFVARTVAAKAVVTVGLATPFLLVLLLWWFPRLRAGPSRIRVATLVALPSLAVTTAPGLLVVPNVAYAAGLLGVLAVLSILAIAGARRLWPSRAVIAAQAAVVALALLAVWIRHEAQVWQAGADPRVDKRAATPTVELRQIAAFSPRLPAAGGP